MRSVGPMLAGLAAITLLSGCAVAPAGPSVAIAPGPNKTRAEFANDQAVCVSLAQQQTGYSAQQINNQQAISAIGGGVLGAVAGGVAGGGQGAAIGAGAGALAGTAVGVEATAPAQANLQQQYDAAYAQCMYARGNIVPGYEAPGYGAAPAGSGLVLAVQRELIRLGYLDGGADGVFGPRTRGAIVRYESANGFPVDGTPSPDLLASLRSSTATARRGWVAPTGGKTSAGTPGSNWVAPAAAAESASPPGNQPGAPTSSSAPGSASSGTPASKWVAPATAPASTMSH